MELKYQYHLSLHYKGCRKHVGRKVSKILPELLDHKPEKKYYHSQYFQPKNLSIII